jgi:hypothetical protein
LNPWKLLLVNFNGTKNPHEATFKFDPLKASVGKLRPKVIHRIGSSFFNLKEGRSRVNASIFYSVIIVENLACVAIFFYANDLVPILRNSSGRYLLLTRRTKC